MICKQEAAEDLFRNCVVAPYMEKVRVREWEGG